MPIAASEAPSEVAFTIIGSGPAVSLGEDRLFSRLTGEDACQPSGRSSAEIEAALAAAGPSGFEPLPYLEGMPKPGLWI